MSTLDEPAAQPSGAATIASIVGGEAARRRARRPPDLHQSRPHLRGRRRGAARRRRAPSSTPAAPRAPRRREWAHRPRARPRPRDRQRRPPRRGQQGGALPPRHARGRQAVRRVARRGPGDHRHLRLLHRRGPAPLRPDRAVGDARQAAVHLPRCRSASPRSSPPATSRSPCPAWYLVPAILCGNAVVWKPAEYAPALGDALAQLFHAGGVPGGVLNLVQADGAATFAGLERALERGPRRQGRLHRLERGRRRDRRALRPPPAVAVPRARRQEPDGRDGRRRPRPRRRGRAVRRLRHRGPALHVARHRDRPRVVHDEFVRRLDERLRAAADRRPDAGRPLRPDARTRASPTASRTGSA